MKFYNRRDELKELKKMAEQARRGGRMTVLTGRRRVGKTLLSLEFIQNQKYLYFFAAKKSEALLCAEYLEEIKRIFPGAVFGEIRLFKDIFALLLQISLKETFSVIIDEFQEFYNINPSVFSEIQKLWDLHKGQCHLNVIVIGSVYSLMHKIFQDSKEPLFNRADRIISLQPFSIPTIYEILQDHQKGELKFLFDYYLLTGGMPKYIELLIENKVFSLSEMIDFVLEKNSPLLNEGKNLLIEEFGKDYAVYFSVLELISVGKTSRPEIESILESNVGGYLDRLEKDYAIIAKYKPIHAKPQSRAQKYRIIDNFINFWFRFIYNHRSTIEAGNFEYVKTIIRRDYATYAGRILEQFFHELFSGTKKFNQVGWYWEKGHENEIDLVAINDLRQEIVMAEIKMNKLKINSELLKKKSKRLLEHYSPYKPQWLSLSLEDAKNYLK